MCAIRMRHLITILKNKLLLVSVIGHVFFNQDKATNLANEDNL